MNPNDPRIDYRNQKWTWRDTWVFALAFLSTMALYATMIALIVGVLWAIGVLP